MKFVYVLEDDLKFQKEICEAIYSIDPKIQIRIFPQLENFVNWLHLLMTTGATAIVKGGLHQNFVPQAEVADLEGHQLAAVISKTEFLGPAQLELIKKTRKVFTDRKICTPEEPTAFVLTAYENTELDVRVLEDPVINNVIYKPFDRIILVQHLIFAIDGRRPPSKYVITNQKASATAEMLKNVSMEMVSDIGFVTKSERELPVGTISKYYGASFISQMRRSILAVCTKSVQHPAEAGAFQNTFTFFGADQLQVSNMRKRSRDKDAEEVVYKWIPLKLPSTDINVVLLDEEEDGPSGLVGHMQRYFEGVRFTSYTSFSAFLADLDPSASVQPKDASMKALGGATAVTLSFDRSGMTYLGFESEKKDLSSLFGVSLKDWKNKYNWFSQAIVNEYRDKYRNFVKTGSLSNDNVLPVSVNDVSYFVKVVNIFRDDKKFQIALSELTKDEQADWLKKNSKLQKQVDLIIASSQLFNDGSEARWKSIKESAKKRFKVEPKIVMTTKKDYTAEQEKMLIGLVHDVFFKPVDRVYFAQKLKHMFPSVKVREKIEIKTIGVEETIKAVQPVTISEISEAGIVIQHNRALELGTFREIVLWQPYEVGAPELIATCNYVEENPSEKGSFNCQLVFFGISDFFLKRIRIWIRDKYVLSKDGQAS